MKNYLVSWCCWNQIEKRHRFSSTIMREGSYVDFGDPIELANFLESVRHYRDNTEIDFRLIAISEIPHKK